MVEQVYFGAPSPELIAWCKLHYKPKNPNTVITYTNWTSKTFSISGTLTSQNISRTRTELTVAGGTGVTSIGAEAFYSCASMTTVEFPECLTIGSSAFRFCRCLSTVSFPKCKLIQNEAFGYHDQSSFKLISFPECQTIEEYAFNWTNIDVMYFPKCTSVGSGAFNHIYPMEMNFDSMSNFTNIPIRTNCLKKVSFNACKSIPESKFWNCTKLTDISFSACETIGKDGFLCCSLLTSVNFPVCTLISDRAFNSCYSLHTAIFPECLSICNTAFEYCSSLTTLQFPKCSIIDYAAFLGCTSLSRIESTTFPEVTALKYWTGDGTGRNFQNCTNLQYAEFQKCSTIPKYAFTNCYKLNTLKLPACTYISSSAFTYCCRLLSLYLEGSSVCRLMSVDAFNDTPIYGYTSYTSGVYGSIYVPMSLVSEYQKASGWSYLSSRFVGI